MLFYKQQLLNLISMEDKFTKEKLEIIENVLSVNNKKLLLQLQYLIANFNSKDEITNIQSAKEKILSFEEWNKQFNDNLDLDDFIPEYNTTLRKFRKEIYEAEIGAEMTMEEFKLSLQTW